MYDVAPVEPNVKILICQHVSWKFNVRLVADLDRKELLWEQVYKILGRSHRFRHLIWSCGPWVKVPMDSLIDGHLMSFVGLGWWFDKFVSRYVRISQLFGLHCDMALSCPIYFSNFCTFHAAPFFWWIPIFSGKSMVFPMFLQILRPDPPTCAPPEGSTRRCESLRERFSSDGLGQLRQMIKSQRSQKHVERVSNFVLYKTVSQYTTVLMHGFSVTWSTLFK